MHKCTLCSYFLWVYPTKSGNCHYWGCIRLCRISSINAFYFPCVCFKECSTTGCYIHDSIPIYPFEGPKVPVPCSVIFYAQFAFIIHKGSLRLALPFLATLRLQDILHGPSRDISYPHHGESNRKAMANSMDTLQVQDALRVQVHDNHILTQNLYCNNYYPKLKYLIIGYC